MREVKRITKRPCRTCDLTGFENNATENILWVHIYIQETLTHTDDNIATVSNQKHRKPTILYDIGVYLEHLLFSCQDKRTYIYKNFMRSR